MGDQVDPPAQEDPYDSSTDSYPTLPYSSNSPRPLPSSPTHSFTVSPDGVSSLPIAIDVSLSSNVVTHSSIVYTPPTPVPSTISTSRSFQTHPSILLTPISSSYNTPLYLPYPPSSFSQTGPSIFPGISSIPPYFGPSFPNTVPMPSQSLPSMVIPSTIPASFSSTRLQPDFGPRPSRRSIKVPRATFPGRRRAPRGRRSRVTSTASCQTSPIPSYFWPDFQPSRVFSGGPSTDGALDLAFMPRAYDHFLTSLPLDPLHFYFFTMLRAASPVVTFHSPSPLTQNSFSFVYSIHFPHGEEAKPLLVTGIHRSVLLPFLHFVYYTFQPF